MYNDIVNYFFALRARYLRMYKSTLINNSTFRSVLFLPLLSENISLDYRSMLK